MGVLCYLYIDIPVSFTELFAVVNKFYVESGEAETPMPKLPLQPERERVVRQNITSNIAKEASPMKDIPGYVFGANPNINRILRMPAAFRTLTPDIRLKAKVKQLPIAHT